MCVYCGEYGFVESQVCGVFGWVGCFVIVSNCDGSGWGCSSSCIGSGGVWVGVQCIFGVGCFGGGVVGCVSGGVIGCDLWGVCVVYECYQNGCCIEIWYIDLNCVVQYFGQCVGVGDGVDLVWMQVQGFGVSIVLIENYFYGLLQVSVGCYV